MLIKKFTRLSFNFAKIFDKTPAESKIKELFGQTSEADKDTKLAIEKAIVRKAREKIQHNQKIRNYHFYEYKRGEDFIENIPTNPDFSYTIKDLEAEEAQKDRLTIQQLSPIRNHQARAKILREKIAAYHDKQKKYEIEEFERYLAQYPGTIRGPRPEDDLVAFRTYAFKKIPKVLLDDIAYQKFLKDEIEEAKTDEIKDEITSPPMFVPPAHLFDFFGQDRDIIDQNSTAEEKQNASNTMEKALQNEAIVEQYKTQVPLMPATNFSNYQQYVKHWMAWLYFRNSYTQYNLEKSLKQLQEKMDKLTKSLLEQDESEWMDLPANIPSLSRYYNCLPKSLQEHPGMKDIYLGLEYSSPDFSYEEKEDALNYTCLWLLPFDQVSTKVLTDYTSHSRLYATPYIHEKIQTISPQFTWDLDKFFDQLKKQELRGETSNQNKDLKYPEPPEVHKMWEQGAANLPVDYYENDDGFWDEIISQKLKRYDQYRPMLKTRKHFTH